MKILMVCLGNICRSPLAEGILVSKVGNDVMVDSAGTGNYHEGHLPDERSVEVADKHGIDITSQRARQFVVQDFDAFDMIFAMDASNYSNILHLARNEDDKAKVKMILNEIYPDMNRSVPDPYFGGKDGFEDVYQMLDEATDKIIEKYLS